METNPMTQHVEVQADGVHAGKVHMKDFSKSAEFVLDGADPEQVYVGHARKWALNTDLETIVVDEDIVAERIKWPRKFKAFHSFRVHHSMSKYTVVALWAAFRPNGGD